MKREKKNEVYITLFVVKMFVKMDVKFNLIKKKMDSLTVVEMGLFLVKKMLQVTCHTRISCGKFSWLHSWRVTYCRVWVSCFFFFGDSLVCSTLTSPRRSSPTHESFMSRKIIETIFNNLCPCHFSKNTNIRILENFVTIKNWIQCVSCFCWIFAGHLLIHS